MNEDVQFLAGFVYHNLMGDGAITLDDMDRLRDLAGINTAATDLVDVDRSAEDVAKPKTSARKGGSK